MRAFFEIICAQAARALHGVERPGYLQLSTSHVASKGMASSRFQDRRCRRPDEGGRHRRQRRPQRLCRRAHDRCRRAENRARQHRATRGVFAFVIDSDADKGKAGHVAAEASLTVESSPGNAHQWCFLDRALTAEQANPSAPPSARPQGRTPTPASSRNPTASPARRIIPTPRSRRAGASSHRPAS